MVEFYWYWAEHFVEWLRDVLKQKYCRSEDFKKGEIKISHVC